MTFVWVFDLGVTPWSFVYLLGFGLVLLVMNTLLVLFMVWGLLLVRLRLCLICLYWCFGWLTDLSVAFAGMGLFVT